jgi:ABC-type glycerol-3-phosphate transport system substrate-binding protein
MKIKKVTVLFALMALAVAALVATSTAGAKTKAKGVSGSISVTGVWTGKEQESFQAVIDGFTAKNPDVKVKYTSSGDQTPTVLATAVQGGNPPDLAAVSQPGLMKDFAARGALKPIDFAKADIAKNYTPSWSTLGSVSGKLYGLFFKGANKSTVWYSVKSFKNAGVKAPATWPQFTKAAKVLRASGTPAYSIGGADGWTLTDLFENIYLRSAGAKKYDQLTTHKIKWTDASVKSALKIMGQVLGDTKNIVGGTSGALQTDFPHSVSNVLDLSPKAAMVIEGDFVPGVVKTDAKPITDYNVFSFPTIGSTGQSVVGGGDIVMMFKDTPAGRAFIQYLASSEAATIWAKRGGFSSPNKNVAASSYSDPLNRSTAIALAHAKTFRFDLSDLQPAAFGGTVGQGEFKIFQDFLKKPSNVNGIASALEKSAAAAYKKK